MTNNVDKIFKQFRSRKTILFFLGVVYALLTVLKKEIGFHIDPEMVVYALALIVIYLQKEGKEDLNKLKTSIHGKKWKDAKFWVAVSGALLPVLSPLLGLNSMPEGAVSTGIACLLMLLFKREKEKEERE